MTKFKHLTLSQRHEIQILIEKGWHFNTIASQIEKIHLPFHLTPFEWIVFEPFLFKIIKIILCGNAYEK